MTKIYKHVEDLIAAVKALPNSYEKNKMNSHLQDVRAWAKMHSLRYEQAPHPAENCICIEGAVDAGCPVHGAPS